MIKIEWKSFCINLFILFPSFLIGQENGASNTVQGSGVGKQNLQNLHSEGTTAAERPNSTESPNAEKNLIRLKALTKLEVAYLDLFFRELFETTTAGYVLYGNKPLALLPFKQPENTLPGTLEHRDAILFAQGLKIWKKLNIKSKNYLLFTQSSDDSNLDDQLILVNRKSFVTAINNHLTLIQYKLGPQVTAKSLLDQLQGKNGFISLFKGEEAIQGILLGYGVENALTYERANAVFNRVIRKEEVSPPYRSGNIEQTEKDLKEKIIAVSQKENPSLLAELEDFSFYTPDQNDSVIPKIPFSFHERSLETKKLLEEYKKTEEEICALKLRDDFLELVLLRLSE